MSFLEGLIQAKPPLKPFVDAKTNLSVFISLLLPKVHFLKVTRVVTLAPPMKFTPTTQRKVYSVFSTVFLLLLLLVVAVGCPAAGFG